MSSNQTSIPTLPQDQGSLRAIKDCAAGSVGGILQVLVGQPFDTVKVKLQTAVPVSLPGSPAPSGSPLLLAFRGVSQDGWTAFYRGTSTPLVGVGMCVSIQFLVLESMKRRLAQRNQAQGSVSTDLSGGQLFLAGATAGLANSVVSGPVEHIRTRLQIQSNENRIYQGPWDAIQKIYKRNGLPGLYKAQGVTALREFQGYGIYFAAYESLVQRECARSGRVREDLGTLEVCAYGAAAGYAMWISMYPIDLVKSRMQTDGWTAKDRQFTSAIDCTRQIWAQSGFRGFWKGLTPCLLRAAPANAVTFLGFEWAMRQLN
ncbi:mitochondrial carrier domain-containing protein [Piptocephalis cylindrospora]|uniref:Mitochondrial carrier domain-containing protein n=1 Tax=Piptocephalis cylindrospora TaxID=1907219 RepID=A0A4P9Y2Z8_9FUNG|nr:mitochondrial carrier domain-containing protein [Piptocephalis cylindrospora]|eukprot:RKP12461.1 mitochondrial carrier domain-containing protein [Piptocephalis cylindrospora]